MEKSPQIVDYENYSSFLKAKFLFLKSTKHRFSHRSFAKEIDSTPAYLKNVMEGRKRIGLSRISKISSVFQLDDFETQYFSFQVIRDLIEDEKTRAYFTSILGRLRFQGTRLGVAKDLNIESDSLRPFSYWLYIPLIELMSFPDFEDSDSWILGKLIDGPGLTAVQIRGAIKDLLEMGAIEKKGNKYVWKTPELSDDTLLSPGPLDEAQFKNFRGLIEKTWEVLGSRGKYQPNYFFQGSFAVNKEDSELLVKTVARHQDEIMQIVANSKNPDRLVAVTNNLFTLAK